MTTMKEYWQFVAATFERLIQAAIKDPAKWPKLVEKFADVPPSERKKALDALATLDADGALTGETRKAIWSELDKLIRQHRKFASADWALPETELEAMEKLANVLLPPDALDANSWLFEEHIPDVGRLGRDFSERQEDVDAAREKAISDVFEAEGFEGLHELARRVRYPWFAGTATASSSDVSAAVNDQLIDLLDSEDNALVVFSSGYATARMRRDEEDWSNYSLERLEGRPLAQARLLQGGDDLEAIWEQVSRLGEEVEKAYWREFSPMGRGADFALVDTAAEMLLKYERPLTAIDLMALYSGKEDRRISTELVARGLETLVDLPEDHDEAAHVSQYEIETLLDYLRASNLDEERLGVLEWKLRPALGFDARTPVLERRLARDPEFFVEVLSLIYRPKGGDDRDEVPEHVASNAWRLLNEWKVIPGSDERQGEVDEQGLTDWIGKVQELLRDADRWEIGHVYIGHVFAHSREDEDETWPTRPVRDAIERLANTDVEDGLAVQTYNNRGVTSRGLLEGGVQERTLADRYRQKADLIRDEWPRTAAVLVGIAESYEADAKRNDAESERWREGLV